MSAELMATATGQLTVRLKGKLTHPEMMNLRKSVAELVKAHGNMRILVIGEGFEGWVKDGDWGNWESIFLQMETDPFIEKMAIVGPKEWKELALLFAGQGLRSFPVEYFTTDQIDDAHSWLG